MFSAFIIIIIIGGLLLFPKNSMSVLVNLLLYRMMTNLLTMQAVRWSGGLIVKTLDIRARKLDPITPLCVRNM